MSNPYYTENFQGAAGNIARAENVQSEFAAVELAFDTITASIASATALINRTVRAPSGETLNELSAAAVRAGAYLRFDASGQPEAAALSTPAFSTVAVSADTAVVKDTRYIILVDSVEMTLPASPLNGDTIYFLGIEATDWFLNRNGNLIMDLTEDLTIDDRNVSFGICAYNGNWRLV